MKKIAIIGSGISGLVAAHLLSRRHEVSLFESNPTLGGHLRSVPVESEFSPLEIDVGVILLNDRYYPRLHEFFDGLNIKTHNADMSWSFQNLRSGLLYSNSATRRFFTQKRSLVSPNFWYLLLEIKNFGLKAQMCQAKGEAAAMTLRDFLERYDFSPTFGESFLAPVLTSMGLNSLESAEDYPAETIFEYFHNHGLFDFGNILQWQSIEGGTAAYIRAFEESFSGKIFLSTPVVSVYRQNISERSEGSGSSVEIETASGARFTYDTVVVAAEPHKALKTLAEPQPLERELLSPWHAKLIRAVLHTDESLLPPLEGARASWNFTTASPLESAVTYDMNRLQGLSSEKKYLVTINPWRPPQKGSILFETTFERTQFDLKSLQIRQRLHELNTNGPVYYCGAYFGRGFLEDGVESALRIVQKLDPFSSNIPSLLGSSQSAGAA